MRRLSHSFVLLLSAALLGGAARATDDGGDGGGRWQLRDGSHGLQAVWLPSGGAMRVALHCDRGDPVVVLRIGASGLPEGLQQVALVVDGLRIDYPVGKATLAGAPALVSRIALDAPLLDRMLVARRFGVAVGGRVYAAGMPGAALARVVRACRDLHWPREARIDPSEAGLAKK